MKWEPVEGSAGKWKPVEGFSAWNRANRYGLTAEQFQALLEDQNYQCAICEADLRGPYRCQVDHDHLTNKLRALLCPSCNRCLGLLKESVEVAEKLVIYLKRFSNGVMEIL